MLFVQKLKVKLSENESEENWPASIISAESTPGKQNGTLVQSAMKNSPYLNGSETSGERLGGCLFVFLFFFFTF